MAISAARCYGMRTSSPFCLAGGALPAVLVLLVTIMAPPAVAQTGSFPNIFGSVAVPMANLQMLPQWTAVIGRMRQTAEPFQDICEAPPSLCHLKQWNAFLISIKGLDKQSQLSRVNDFMNNFPYVTDIMNWARNDFWETPLEFQHKGGECKDYAVAKYWSLRYLGWPVDQLRVVVLQDLNLRIAHAILVVDQDNQALVLDSQIKGRVVNASSINHYRATYSLNELHWWLHRGG